MVSSSFSLVLLGACSVTGSSGCFCQSSRWVSTCSGSDHAFSVGFGKTPTSLNRRSTASSKTVGELGCSPCLNSSPKLALVLQTSPLDGRVASVVSTCVMHMACLTKDHFPALSCRCLLDKSVGTKRNTHTTFHQHFLQVLFTPQAKCWKAPPLW